MRIALIEDSPFLVEAWTFVADYELETYGCPEEFFTRYTADPQGLLQLDGIVTDFYFDEVSQLTGSDVLEWVKHRQGPPVLLSTNGTPHSLSQVGFAAIIEKDPLLSADLARILGRVVDTKSLSS